MAISVIQQEFIAAVRVKRITQRAKELCRGDSIVFDPTSSILQAFRHIESESEIIIAVQCPWIKEEKDFRDLVQLLGLVAIPVLTTTIRDMSVPEPLWAYQYI